MFPFRTCLANRRYRKRVKKNAQAGITEDLEAAEPREEESKRDEGNLQVLVIPSEADNRGGSPQTSPTDVPVDITVSEGEFSRVSVTVEQSEAASPPPLSPTASDVPMVADSTVLRVGFAPYAPASAQTETVDHADLQREQPHEPTVVSATQPLGPHVEHASDVVEAIVNEVVPVVAPVSPTDDSEGIGTVVGHMNGEAAMVTPAVSISVVDTMVIEDVTTPAPSPSRNVAVTTQSDVASVVVHTPSSPIVDAVLALPEPSHDNVVIEDITSPLQSPQPSTFVFTTPISALPLPVTSSEDAIEPEASPRDAAVAAVFAELQPDPEPAAVSGGEATSNHDTISPPEATQ